MEKTYKQNEYVRYDYYTPKQTYETLDVHNVKIMKIECYGAGTKCGGGNGTAYGGYTYGTLYSDSRIKNLYIFIGNHPNERTGGYGWGTGGKSVYPEGSKMMGYGGAGGTAVVTDPNDDKSVLMVAGGAGGGTDLAIAYDTNTQDKYGNEIINYNYQYYEGYNGGGFTGQPITEKTIENWPGWNADGSGYHAGLPGTQTEPGKGGCINNSTPHSDEIAWMANGIGNRGGQGRPDNSSSGGGTPGGAPGGGGGYYGGGGGCIRGGGGSGYVSGNPNCPVIHPDGFKFYDSNSVIGGNENYDGRVVVTILGYQPDVCDIGCTFTVYNPPESVDVTIPFPYKQFTDTVFFCTDIHGLFISDAYYERIGERTIRFKGNHYNLNEYEDIRFVFCHNKNQYAIQKFEIHMVSKLGYHQYKISTPYYAILDLNMRFKVFYDRRELNQGTDYSIMIYDGILVLDNSVTVEEGKDIDIVCFYTGSGDKIKYSHSTPELPMSGYFYLKKHEIDRNYNKNLMAVFVNGKLLPRDNITDMSNNIHKVNRNIKSRYNLQILNMSPKIKSLVPFYKKNYSAKEPPKQYKYQEFSCILEVPTNKIPHNRYKIDGVVNPLYLEGVLDHPEWYISLIHHGSSDYKVRVSYKLKFFNNDYDDNPSKVNVLTQLSYPTKEQELDSNTCLLLGVIPEEIKDLYVDYSMFTLQIKTIMEMDTEHREPPDGILCMLQIDKPKYGYKPYIYYELTSNDYEVDNKIGIFEWVVSDEPDGKGHVYYRKTIWMRLIKEVDLDEKYVSKIAPTDDDYKA